MLSFAAFQLPACTCVPIALVRVYGQIVEVRVGVLVRWSGHNEMHQAFCFSDSGDSFGVGHSGHEFLIYL